MQRRRSRQDPRELPAYGISEAAYYLHLPAATLRSWSLGRQYRWAGSARHSAPVLSVADAQRPALSFINLVEAHVLSAIRRQHHLPFTKVRSAVAYLKEQLHSRHPLADWEFTTDGMNLFIEHLDRFINVTQGGQLAVRELLELYLQRIERDPKGVPLKLYPFVSEPEPTEPKVIVIDPFISFGRPVIAGTGIPTAVLAQRSFAGESPDELAADYGRERAEIEEAIRWERERRPKAA
jgi:uncharacterized protein (DUF433 family)